MRRSERITAWAGAALVAATTLATVLATAVHAGETHPAPGSTEGDLVPADLVWALVDSCADAEGRPSSYGLSMLQDGRGTVRLEVIDATGEPMTDPAVQRYEGAVNECLATYRVASDGALSELWEDRPDAQRMVMADHLARSLGFCIRSHGLELTSQASDYLDRGRLAWTEVYQLWSQDARSSFDRLLQTRRDCGLPTDVVAGW